MNKKENKDSTLEKVPKEYFLSLGSNIGDLELNLSNAIKYISETKGIIFEKKSKFYKTAPWGNIEQNDFLNAVIKVKSFHTPEDFLEILKSIECKMGKKFLFKWGPRIIDIDILFCDDLVIETENLKIPHPLMHKRDFAILPMKEIAEEFIHPILKKRMKEL